SKNLTVTVVCDLSFWDPPSQADSVNGVVPASISEAAGDRSTLWLRVAFPPSPPPKNWLPPSAGPSLCVGKPSAAPYGITVGVPPTCQPGIDTALYPDSEASPISAPPLTRRLGLSTANAAGLATISSAIAAHAAATGP